MTRVRLNLGVHVANTSLNVSKLLGHSSDQTEQSWKFYVRWSVIRALKHFSSDGQSTGHFIILHDSLWPVPQDIQNIVSQNKNRTSDEEENTNMKSLTPDMFLHYICRVTFFEVFLNFNCDRKLCRIALWIWMRVNRIKILKI